MIMTVFAGIAQFERSLILSRTDEGRKAAMVRGVTFGRPKKMRLDQAELARQLVLEGKRSEEHTSELQSLMHISYAVSCLKTQKYTTRTTQKHQNTLYTNCPNTTLTQ